MEIKGTSSNFNSYNEVIIDISLPLTFNRRFSTATAIKDIYDMVGEYCNVTQSPNALGEDTIIFGTMEKRADTKILDSSVYIITIGI